MKNLKRTLLSVILAFILWLLLAFALLIVAPLAQAEAAEVRIDACPTILDSQHADWLATRLLFQRYGAWAEGNPVVRLVGPDPYFGIGMVGTAALCRETPAWRWVAVGTWLVQTWAVNSHGPWGTLVRPPMLWITIRW